VGFAAASLKMKKQVLKNRFLLLFLTISFAFLSIWANTLSINADPALLSPTDTSSAWVKYSGNPVLGGQYGTCFDISVLKEDPGYRMWVSWRPQHSIALVTSKDGLNFNGMPQAVLGPRASGWENDDVNRPVVIKLKDGYHMWYTGQADGHSAIGYAISPDGITWKRMSDKPVLSADVPWEKVAVMCPDVMWDARAKLYKMWYSGGEQYEPDAIGYATSPDGLNWAKFQSNPIFANDPTKSWEQHKVTACQVIHDGDWYYMFYIGFEDINHAQICLARSKDGITGWERNPNNPIVKTSVRGEVNDWDSSACYKPYAIYDGKQWLLWYNGRKDGFEQIGVVIHQGKDLGFGQPTGK
jgi:predicted GH43/DUF377 family glycosyl hydrolase